MTQVTNNCPHCGAANAYGAAFCQNCGKGLPPALPTGPRVVGVDQAALTDAGFKLQTEELHKQAKKAAGVLLAIAILQFVVGGFLYLALSNAPQRGNIVFDPTMMLVSTVGVGIVYLGLFFWARRNPLPAAIVGLLVYLTLTVADIVAIAGMARDAGGQGGSGGYGSSSSSGPPMSIPWLKIIIVIILVQAIQAGLKHRKLLQQQRARMQGGFAA